jgi:hypothetical protein
MESRELEYWEGYEEAVVWEEGPEDCADGRVWEDNRGAVTWDDPNMGAVTWDDDDEADMVEDEVMEVIMFTGEAEVLTWRDRVDMSSWQAGIENDIIEIV